MYLLLNGSSLVFLQLELEIAAPHFDAQLSPGPHISHGSPDLSLVQGAHKVSHNLHKVFEILGLDSPDLCLTDTPQAVLTRSLISATGSQTDLCVARDNPVPERS